MKDLRTITVRVNLPINQVNRISSNSPTLRIIGDRFLEAKAIFINDIEATTFAILSVNEILVELPMALRNTFISSVAVVTDSFTVEKSNLLHFNIGNSIRSISGIERLIQHFVKVLLQRAGSNKFAPQSGGNLLSMIGNTSGQDQGVISDIIDGVNRTKNEIITNQTRNKRIPIDEKLLNVTIVGVGFTEDKTGISLTLELTNMVGNNANVLLAI